MKFIHPLIDWFGISRRPVCGWLPAANFLSGWSHTSVRSHLIRPQSTAHISFAQFLNFNSNFSFIFLNGEMNQIPQPNDAVLHQVRPVWIGVDMSSRLFYGTRWWGERTSDSNPGQTLCPLQKKVNEAAALPISLYNLHFHGNFRLQLHNFPETIFDPMLSIFCRN